MKLRYLNMGHSVTEGGLEVRWGDVRFSNNLTDSNQSTEVKLNLAKEDMEEIEQLLMDKLRKLREVI